MEEVSAIEPVNKSEGHSAFKTPVQEDEHTNTVENDEKINEKNDEANDNKENCDDNVEKVDDPANVENDEPDGNVKSEDKEKEEEISVSGDDGNIPTISLLDASDDTGINACAECDEKSSKKRAGNEVGSLYKIFSLFNNNGCSLFLIGSQLKATASKRKAK